MRLLLRAVVALAVLVGVAVATMLVLQVVGVAHMWRVPAASMEPTLRCSGGLGCTGRTTDHVLSWKYFGDDPKRGDIVVFHTPPAAARSCGAGGVFVKRVVALPGETWEERRGRVFVNRRPLAEPYVRPRARDARTIPPRRVPNGRYFVLGDNRTASCDSRVWGPVARSAIIGKAVLRYWPPWRIGVL